MERFPVPRETPDGGVSQAAGLSGREHPALTVLLCHSPTCELRSLSCNTFT